MRYRIIGLLAMGAVGCPPKQPATPPALPPAAAVEPDRKACADGDLSQCMLAAERLEREVPQQPEQALGVLIWACENLGEEPCVEASLRLAKLEADLKSSDFPSCVSGWRTPWFWSTLYRSRRERSLIFGMCANPENRAACRVAWLGAEGRPNISDSDESSLEDFSRGTSTVSGIVRDPNGRPIAGAVIVTTRSASTRFDDIFGPKDRAGLKTTISRADGSYTLSGLQPGPRIVYVDTLWLAERMVPVERDRADIAVGYRQTGINRDEKVLWLRAGLRVGPHGVTVEKVAAQDRATLFKAGDVITHWANISLAGRNENEVAMIMMSDKPIATVERDGVTLQIRVGRRPDEMHPDSTGATMFMGPAPPSL